MHVLRRWASKRARARAGSYEKIHEYLCFIIFNGDQQQALWSLCIIIYTFPRRERASAYLGILRVSCSYHWRQYNSVLCIRHWLRAYLIRPSASLFFFFVRIALPHHLSSAFVSFVHGCIFRFTAVSGIFLFIFSEIVRKRLIYTTEEKAAL